MQAKAGIESRMKSRQVLPWFAFSTFFFFLVFAWPCHAQSPGAPSLPNQEKTGTSIPKYRMKFATIFPSALGEKLFEDIVLPAINQSTNSELSVKVYFGSVIGDEENALEKMNKGLIDGVWLSGKGTATAVSQMTVLGLPFLFKNLDEVDYIKKKMRTPFFQEAGKKGLFPLAWLDQGFEHMYSKNFDFAYALLFFEERFANWQGPLEKRFLLGLGAIPVEMEGWEILSGLCPREVPPHAEAIIAPADMIVGTQLYTCLKYINPIQIRYSPELVFVSKHSWARLPEKYRDSLLKARDSVERDLCEAMRSNEEKMIKEMIRYGLEQNPVLPETREFMRKKAMSLWVESAGEMYPRELLNEVLFLLREYRRVAQEVIPGRGAQEDRLD